MDLFLLILAVIPVVVLLVLTYFGNRIERTPIGLVFALLGMGILSTIPAMIIEFIGEGVLSFFFRSNSLIYNFLLYFFVVAVAEELCKFLFMAVITWKNKHFNYVYDGVVYAVSASLGFALFENLNYVFSTRLQLGVLAGMSVGVGRAFLAVPLHAGVAIFMGFFYGKAKEAMFRHRGGMCALYLLLSLAVPMLIHGIYDFCCDSSSVLMMLVFWVFVAGMYTFTIVMCIYFSKHNHTISGRLKVKVTADGWLRYAVTDQCEVIILGLTRPYAYRLLVIPEEIDAFPVRAIGRAAFAYTNLVDIRLPASLRVIEDMAFFNCPYLREVMLPNQMQGIGNFAFEYCYSMRRFLIPHLRFLGNHVFDGCNQLSDIYYLGSPNEWRTVRIRMQENRKLLMVRFYYNTVRQ